MRNRKKLYSTRKEHLSIFSKIIIIVLVLGLSYTPSFGVCLAKSINIGKEPTVIEELQDNIDTQKVELTYLREPNLKVYLNPDYTLEYVYYDKDIHYFNGTKYIELDRFDEQKNNKTYSVNYPDVLNSNEWIKIEYNDYVLSYKFNNVKESNKENIKDSVKYNDIFTSYDNITLLYDESKDTLKENIILSNYIENFSFSFLIKFEGLILESINDSYIIKNSNNEVIFSLSPFYMYDSQNNISYSIDTSIDEHDEGEYEFIITPADTWLKNAVYPVTIDPIIETQNTDYSFSYQAKSYLKEYATTDPYNNAIYVGNPTWETGGLFSIVEFTKPTINVDFTNAEVVFTNKDFEGNGTFDIYKINTSLNYDQINSINYQSLDKSLIYSTFYSTQEFSIPYSDIFGSNSKTLLYFSGNSDGYIDLSDDSSEPKPIIRISNVINKLVGTSYDEIEIPNAGMAKINIATGELFYEFKDLSVSNDSFSFNLSHLFRGSSVDCLDYMSPYGRGFNINYHETLELINASTYKYTKADGSEVFFIKPDEENDEYIDDNTFISNDSSNYKLVVRESLPTDVDDVMYKYTLYAEDIRVFDKISSNDTSNILYLTKIMESLYIDNAINISYAYVNYIPRIIQVVDGAGNTLNFTYDLSTNLLANVSVEMKNIDINGVSSNPIFELAYRIVYTYDNYSRLVKMQIIYNGNTQSPTSINISYNDSSQIEKVYYGTENEYLIGKEFSYVSSPVFLNQIQVASYKSFLQDSLESFSDEKSYSYKNNKTIITSINGTVERYWFDIFANVVKKDYSNGNIVNYVYDNTVLNYKNLIDIVSSTGNYTNMLRDPNCLGTSIWTSVINNNGSITKYTSELIPSSKVVCLERNSLLGDFKHCQQVLLPKGKYFLSSYVKTDSSDGGGYLSVETLNSSDSNLLKIVAQNDIISLTSGNYKPYVIEFEILSDTTIVVGMETNTLAKVYFDNTCLNSTSKNVQYNLIENSSFEYSSNGIADGFINLFNSPNGGFVTVDEYSNLFGSNCGLIFSNQESAKNINCSGYKDDEFNFSIWYCPTYYEEMLKYGYLQFKIEFTNSVGEKTVIKVNSKTVQELQDDCFSFDSINVNIIAPIDYVSIKISMITYAHECFLVDNMSFVKTLDADSINDEEESNNEETTDDVVYDENNDLTESISIDSRDDSSSILYRLPKIEDITINNRFKVYDRMIEFSLYSAIDKAKYLETGEDSQYTPEYSEFLELISRADTFGSRKILTTTPIYDEDSVYGYNHQYIIEQIDEIYGNTTYLYNSVTGNMNSSTYNGVITTYNYDVFNRLTSIIREIDENYDSINISYTYDNFNRVTSITTSSGVFGITYSNYGNITSVSVNGEILATYEYLLEYGMETSQVTKVDYANGFTIVYEYNTNEKLQNVLFKNNDIIFNNYVLEYDFSDNLIHVEDELSDYEYFYEYDIDNNLIKITNNENITITYKTDENENKYSIYKDGSYLLTETTSVVDDNTHYQVGLFSYYFDQIEVNEEDNEELTEYTRKIINFMYGTSVFNSTYLMNSFSFIEKIEYVGHAIEYYYSSGVINKVIYSSTNGNQTEFTIETYEYNGLNQLTHHSIYHTTSNPNILEIEDLVYDCFYEYDTNGNIISIYRPVIMNEYDSFDKYIEFIYNVNNKDQLVSRIIKSDKYGTTLSTYNYEYDDLGNLIREFVNGELHIAYSYTGRNMTSYHNYESNIYIEYKYNESNIRYSKKIYQVDSSNDISLIESHYYTLVNDYIKLEKIDHYEDDELTKEEILYIYYDDEYSVIGLNYYNSILNTYSDYFFQKNATDDVIAIFNSDFVEVAKYTYDAIGNLVYIDGLSNIKNINPFRYRSYYFDSDTNLYYLNTRYYDSCIGRFMCSDDVQNMLSPYNESIYNNLYVYCDDDFINKIDNQGNFFITLVGVGIQLDVSLVLSGGIEIIYFFGKKVKDKGFHIYFYGGLNISDGGIIESLCASAKSIAKNKLTFPTSKNAGISFSVSVVFVFQINKFFKKKLFSSSDYEGPFYCFSATIHHLKSSLAIGDTCYSVSIGITTDYLTIGYSSLVYQEYLKLNVSVNNMYSAIKSKYKFMF